MIGRRVEHNRCAIGARNAETSAVGKHTSAARPRRFLVALLGSLCLWSYSGITCYAASPASKPSTPEEVVRAYTDAANRHDLEGFLALYAVDIRKYRFPGELTSQGIDHNRTVYQKSFAAAPDLKIQIVELTTLGDKVMVHDRVTGRADGKSADEFTIYQVQDGRITNIVYVEQQVH